MARPTKALINFQALRHNYQLANSLAPQSLNMPIVKANAYGHGAAPIAKALEDLAPAFGVACIEEAIELREAGITKPILLLEGTFTKDEVAISASQNFWLTIDNQEQKEDLLNAKLTSPIKVWLCVDSGMHRLGNNPEDIKSIYAELAASSNVDDDIVLSTHFACSDELDNDFTQCQIDLFRSAITGIDAPTSLSNSAGILGWPQAIADWNRPGIMLYGNSPFAEPHPEADKLKPVMTLKSGVISVREIAAGETVGYAASWKAERTSRIATIALGYGDGYPRHAQSGTPVLVNGLRCPLIGRVSMDMITVDVTDIPTVAIGDEVILWGEEITANEIASHASTIGYEVVTRMAMRTPRIYID